MNLVLVPPVFERVVVVPRACVLDPRAVSRDRKNARLRSRRGNVFALCV